MFDMYGFPLQTATGPDCSNCLGRHTNTAMLAACGQTSEYYDGQWEQERAALARDGERILEPLEERGGVYPAHRG